MIAKIGMVVNTITSIERSHIITQMGRFVNRKIKKCYAYPLEKTAKYGIIYTMNKKEGTNMTDVIMSPEEKKEKLFLEQKRTLDIFLSNGAITRAQYNKSYGDLVKLMGFEELAKKIEEKEGEYRG